MIIAVILALVLWGVAVGRASRSLSPTQLAVFAIGCLLLFGGLLGAETVADPSANHRIHVYDWRFLGIAAVGFVAAAAAIAAGATRRVEKGRPLVRIKPGAVEWGVILLLPVGGILVGVGWCVIIMMLWTSRAWSRGEKLLATLALPGGPVVAFVIYDEVATSGWPDIVKTPVLAATVAVGFLPTAAGILLARRLRDREAPANDRSSWRRGIPASG